MRLAIAVGAAAIILGLSTSGFAAGKPAVVVGVFIKAGAENAGLARAFQGLPGKSGDTSAPAAGTIDARALLPADKTFFTYA